MQSPCLRQCISPLSSPPSACCLQVLRLGNIVPDFTAMTTQGEIHWHDWIDGKWAILFSHPADFTCGFNRLAVVNLNPVFLS